MPPKPSVKKVRMATKEIILSELAKVIDQTVVPQLISKLNTHHKVLYGNGKPGLLTELAVFKQQVSDQIAQVTKEISGEEGVTTRLTRIEAWQSEMSTWKNGVVLKVGMVCGFFAGLGSLAGILLDRVEVIHNLFGGLVK
jgi:hypothetical protein